MPYQTGNISEVSNLKHIINASMQFSRGNYLAKANLVIKRLSSDANSKLLQKSAALPKQTNSLTQINRMHVIECRMINFQTSSPR